MEIRQTFPGEFFTRQRLVALDDRVIFHHKDIYKEMTREYYYSQLSPSLSHGRLSQHGWSELAWFLTIPSVSLALYILISRGPSSLAWVAAGGFALPLLIGYTLRLRKDEVVGFSYKTGPIAFTIKVSGRGGGARREFVEYVRMRIPAGSPT